MSAQTELLFQEDSYLRQCTATVISAADERGIVLDKTVFYATGGGQPGDSGSMTLADGQVINIIDTIKDRESGTLFHVTEAGATRPQDQELIELSIDWNKRYQHMRMHSCLHMMCALVDAPVTGGSVQQQKGRLDFDLDQSLDKEKLTSALNSLISADHPMSTQWITDEELDANPEMVRTLSAKPPRGTGKIRLVNFEGIDLQPCGGTHIASTAEIGKVRVSKIEKKGRQNRRITVVFDE